MKRTSMPYLRLERDEGVAVVKVDRTSLETRNTVFFILKWVSEDRFLKAHVLPLLVYGSVDFVRAERRREIDRSVLEVVKPPHTVRSPGLISERMPEETARTPKLKVFA